MNLLSGILGSEAIQKLAFGSIKKLIKEKGLKCIIISLDEQEEIKLEFVNNQNQLLDESSIKS